MTYSAGSRDLHDAVQRVWARLSASVMDWVSGEAAAQWPLSEGGTGGSIHQPLAPPEAGRHFC